MTSYERVLGVLNGSPTDRLALMPITMMLAADQIGVPYGKYIQDYRLLVEGQIRTAENFGFDHVSCISDPGREPEALGAAVQYFDDQPAAFDERYSLLADKSALRGLKVPNPSDHRRMHDRLQAAALFRQRVGGEKLIEGWIEGPCAEAADLRGLNRLMVDFFDDPAFVRDLLDFSVVMELEFARCQIEAGVDSIGIGDSATSLVGPQIYEEFLHSYQLKLIGGIKAMGARVRLHVCGNIRKILGSFGTLGCDIIDIDSMVPLDAARQEMGPAVALLGNITPVAVLRNGTPEAITKALAECHRKAGDRYIVGAGCEVPRDTPAANIMALRDYARSNS